MIQAWNAKGELVRIEGNSIASPLADRIVDGVEYGVEYYPPVRTFSEAGFVVSNPGRYSISYVELCRKFLRKWG